jgi:hypothetical protein
MPQCEEDQLLMEAFTNYGLKGKELRELNNAESPSSDLSSQTDKGGRFDKAFSSEPETK